ncbi:MAG: LysM peptidoglycan-binding domain-containing protein [Candidatus Improbicoccus pseudotrichonymphae]|uniref:LysM peptidoglycan-binding domain-containing protein n=1 Tax=Candidatus Improbicoccus pseudotrichonymphae TaxID=3033792 RepID=A0AA48KVB0_9FIRM|nr:MAG: LysM peptidoglycan-binding domain-containing protein [Candidatus Improbicoccus pseudotrichonymphae]
MEYNGIDVSGFQGYIDWGRVNNSGIRFAIIRATYGQNGVDNRFKENMNNIGKTNISAGVYHYCYATSENESFKEAQHFIKTIFPYKVKYPAALVIEERSIANLGKEKVTNIVKIFIEAVSKAGYYPIVYSGEKWINNFIDLNKISDVDLWVAKWGFSPPSIKNFSIWQKGNSGRIPGIGDNVNIDIAYKDYDSIIKNTSSDNINQNTNEAPKNKTDFVEYIVKPGDTLWSIAQKFLGRGQDYRKIINKNSMLGNEIYAGQKLKIPSNTNGNWTLYNVQRGDTLLDIAEKYLNSPEKYLEIKKINNLKNNLIYAGQILKLPKTN